MNIFQDFEQTRKGFLFLFFFNFYAKLNISIKADWWQYASICQTYAQNKLPPQKVNSDISS